MIRLTRLTDYAVTLLCELAQEGSVAVSAQELSMRTSIAEPTVSKALKKLSKAGLLTSIMGPQGGYKIAKDHRNIGVADVIRAIDGPIAITRCSEDSTQICALEEHCTSKKGWQKVDVAIKQALEKVTLEEFMHHDR